jgi:hypothetical protein
MEVDALFQLNDRHSGGLEARLCHAKEKKIEISREYSDCFYMFIINPKPSDVEKLKV